MDFIPNDSKQLIHYKLKPTPESNVLPQTNTSSIFNSPSTIPPERCSCSSKMRSSISITFLIQGLQMHRNWRQAASHHSGHGLGSVQKVIHVQTASQVHTHHHHSLVSQREDC